MSPPVLVAYATKKESTHEVADAVAARLRELGQEVDVRPAAEVGTLSPYGAVVVGGALYAGRWHRDARRFLATHREQLARRPVAVFAMGPLKLEPAEVEGARNQLDRALAKEHELTPASVTIFGGVIDPAKLHFPFDRMPAGDARDWDAIRSWADSLAEIFAAHAVA
ncbi:MAG TPA: flavodoxin domain-containing protein [Solirubrobacteraceae bacterium]|jgi:menaquinone-dependent protoporphyrinogen oxidase|nr:flavodoxin domain-containing protein [Solirubrobacteraceae bacterium]